jgi:type I restriction-modification system DNA methylase subunit
MIIYTASQGWHFMADLFSSQDNHYAEIYAGLGELRELFHQRGHFDDANAKLDEITKFLAIHLAARKGLVSLAQFGLDKDHFEIEIEPLQRCFAATARLPIFSTETAGSIFGEKASLAVKPGDEDFATKLFRLSALCLSNQARSKIDGIPFDVINEAFGHFVRENFRNNIEDAQYMTPPEVTSFMVDLAVQELADGKNEPGKDELVVLDPSCGVGSFLSSFKHSYDKRLSASGNRVRLNLVGQDKVDRMVRLSTINLLLLDNVHFKIEQGNSLEDGSALSKLDGKVDIILTNPPFGARFDSTYIKARCQKSLPFFSNLRLQSRTFDSELLFLDRYVRLLRDGGICLVVVPDGVISAKGIASLTRHELARHIELLAVVELPSVTFAQAGTRTKTAVLYFRKRSGRSLKPNTAYFAAAEDIGFDVHKRKSVPIKIAHGRNQLPQIAELHRNGEKIDAGTTAKVVSRAPYCAWARVRPSELDAWSPRHFGSDEHVSNQRKNDSIQFTPLRDLVDFSGHSRRNVRYDDRYYYLSVLHVLGEGMLDVFALKTYRPITPGVPVEPGEVIISRINPRIPRVAVVPHFDRPLLCSSEFEVLRPKNGLSAHALAYLLLTAPVQSQICALASGTSASHNRVKPEKLADVLIPLPNKGTQKHKAFGALVAKYEKASNSLTGSSWELAQCRAEAQGIGINASFDEAAD